MKIGTKYEQNFVAFSEYMNFNSNNFLQTQDANGQMSKPIFLLYFCWKLQGVPA